MSCKHLKIRTKKYEKYFYCKNFKSKVNFNFCKECEYKEYKKIKKMKCKKHDRTKSTEIPKYVKEIVWYRDRKECIFCHKKVSVFFSNAHFIPRSAGGLGIEQNIFTACPECHIKQDNGVESGLYTLVAENYLKSIYRENWNKENLIYQKYKRREEL